jgi:hypothetical protein
VPAELSRPAAEVRTSRRPAEARRFPEPAPLRPPRPLHEAYVSLVRSNLEATGMLLCFFTGTYSDAYGYSHGLMLPRNAQADFRRFLKSQGLGDASFACAVEDHACRAIVHLHALIAVRSIADMDRIHAAWASDRGLASAPPCTDGGLSYVCKYALKGDEVDRFDWRFSGPSGAATELPKGKGVRRQRCLSEPL